jgi:hypothetical protein
VLCHGRWGGRRKRIKGSRSVLATETERSFSGALRYGKPGDFATEAVFSRFEPRCD